MFDDIVAWMTQPAVLIAVQVFVLFLWLENRKLRKDASQSIERIALAIGQLRVRIENLEGTVYGEKRAREKYEWAANIENNPTFRDDPDAVQAKINIVRRRDGGYPPNFSGWMGDDGIYGRLRNVEKHLGLKYKDDDD